MASMLPHGRGPATPAVRWDIGPTWQLEADADRVELEHRNIDRHGPGWESTRDSVDGRDGWPLHLDRNGAMF